METNPAMARKQWNCAAKTRTLLTVRIAGKLLVIVVFVLLVLNALGQSAMPGWRVFTNRAGWSAHYPESWTIASCHNCKDPTAPDVFVDFFPPGMRTAEGWVMISTLADKPPDASVDAWLAEVSTGHNQNPHVNEQSLTLNGLPALKVRYHHPDGDMEDVYVLSGSRTFSIGFSADPGSPETPLERLRNYETYLKIVQSFHVKQR